MNILFIHQNFPGQFKFLAPALAKLGHRVVAMTMQKVENKVWQGVELVQYSATRGSTPNVHPWVSDFETKTIRGEACFRAALVMKSRGYSPDAIIAHPGWGESLFIKEVWPQAKLGLYCEFFYQALNADVGFDPEFPSTDPGDSCRLRLKNLNNLLHSELADAGISPTTWQASTFPESFRKKISVIHDGIDTDFVSPNTEVEISITLSNGQTLNLDRTNEIITFVNRNLEPYRGYHIFMRSLPHVLKSRPNARVLIVGADDVSYGSRPNKEKYGLKNWRDIFLDEIKGQLKKNEIDRIHFLGNIPYQQFIPILQLSSLHVYLTYPFVLSWSLLEAMSAGCAIVASDTAPVAEAIENNKTGRLINFFNHGELAENIIDILKDKEKANIFGMNARDHAIKNYDLKNHCLPNQINWVNKLLNI
jgi:glycosyltransferase involved in cell wall biosynthesis